MIENITAVTNVGYAGLVCPYIRRMRYAGKETKQAREIRVQKALEEARKIVPPVYNLKAKLIEYDNYGRHLDVKA